MLNESQNEKKKFKKEALIKSRDLEDALKSKSRIQTRLSELEDELSLLRTKASKQIIDVKEPLQKKINLLVEELRLKSSNVNLLQNQFQKTKEQLGDKAKDFASLTSESESSQLKMRQYEIEVKASNRELIILSNEKMELEKKYIEVQQDKNEVERMLASVKEDYERLEASFVTNVAVENEPLKQKVEVLISERKDYKREVLKLKKKIKILEDFHVDKEEQVEALRLEIREGLNNKFKMEKLVESKEDKSKSLVQKIDSLTNLLNKAVKDVASKDLKLEENNNLMLQLKKDQKKLGQESVAVIKEKNVFNNKLSKKNLELLRQQEKLQQITDKLNTSKVQYVELQRKYKEKQSKIREPLQQKIVLLNLELEESESATRSLTERLEDTAQQLGGKMDRVNRLTDTMKSSESKLTSIEDKLSKSRIEIDSLMQQKKSVAKQSYEAEAKKAELQKDLNDLKRKHEELKVTSKQKLEGQTLALRGQVDLLIKAKNDNREKILRLQRDLGMAKENVIVREGILEESDKTLKQNEQTITTLSGVIREKEKENKNLMAKIITLNEELNSAQKDLSLNKAEVARYKERVYFLEIEHDRLKEGLNNESVERGSLSVELRERETALFKAQENETALSKELEGLEQKLMSMKTSLSRKVAMAKEPLQARIIELAGIVREQDGEIGEVSSRLAILKQKIEEKTRSVLRLKRKLSPYGDALDQSKSEFTQRKEELEQISTERDDLKRQMLGVKSDYIKIQEELDDVKKDIIKKGLKYRRRQDPYVEAISKPVKEDLGRIVESAHEKADALGVKVKARANELEKLNLRYIDIDKKFNEKTNTLKRLSDESVLYGDALEQTEKEVIKLNETIKAMTVERLDLKAKLIDLEEAASIKKKDLEGLKLKHVEVESSLLDQVVQTRNLLKRKVETLSSQMVATQKDSIALASEAEILKQYIQEKDIQIASLEKRISLNEEAAKQIEQGLKQKEVFIKGVEVEYAEMREQYRILEEKLKASNDEKDQLRAQIVSLGKEHDKFASLIKRGTGEKEYLTRELIKKSDLVTQLQDSELNYIAQIDELTLNLDKARLVLNNEIRESVVLYKKKIAVYEDELKEESELGAELMLKIEDMEKSINDKNKSISRSSIDLNECQMRLARTRDTLKARTDEIELIRNQKNTFEKDLFKARLSNDDLVKESAELRAQNIGLKKHLDLKMSKINIKSLKQLSVIEDKYAQAEATIKQVEQERADVVKKLREKEKIIAEVQNKLEVSKYKVTQVEETSSDLRGENKALQETIASLKEELKHEQQSGSGLRSELKIIRDRNAALLNERAQLTVLLERGTGDKKQLTRELLAKSKKQAEFEEKYKQSSKELVRAQEKLNKSKGKVELKGFKSKQESEKRIAKLVKKLGERKVALGELAAKISEINVALKNEKIQVINLNEVIRQLQKELKKQKDAKKNAESQLMTLNKQVQNYKHSIESLEIDNLSLGKELASTKKQSALLKESVKDKISRACRPLEKENVKYEEDLRELQAVYDDLRSRTPGLSQEIKSKDREIIEFTKQQRNSKKKLESLLNKINVLESQLATQEVNCKEENGSSKKSFSSEILKLNDALKAKAVGMSTLTKELSFLEKQLQEKDEQIADFMSEKLEQEESRSNFKSRLAIAERISKEAKGKYKDQLAGVQDLLHNDIVELKAKVVEKDATIKLLADHVEENKKIVTSLKKELSMHARKRVNQSSEVGKAKDDVVTLTKETKDLQDERDQLKSRNEELLELVKSLESKKIVSSASFGEKDEIIQNLENEVMALQEDQKELTQFLKKEISARKSNIKELVAKTKDLNETKRQHRQLIEKIKKMQENMLTNRN